MGWDGVHAPPEFDGTLMDRDMQDKVCRELSERVGDTIASLTFDGALPSHEAGGRSRKETVRFFRRIMAQFVTVFQG